MINIFKKQNTEISNNNDTSLLVEKFNDLNINIYGTYEEPLFKAKDIGDLLGIKDIRTTLREFDEDEWHTMPLIDSLGRNQETNMLKEQGLYKILMISRKPIAKQFQKWVFNVIKEIRLKGKYDLEEQLKAKELETQNLIEEKEKKEIETQKLLEEKEQKEIETQKLLEEKELELIKYKEKIYEEIEKTGHIYVIKTDGGTKVGKTKDAVKKRIKGLQTGNMNDIEMLLDFKTSNADLLEKTVHYILDRYRCNSNREFFDCDIDYIKRVVNIIGNTIDTLKSCYQNITQDELLDKLNVNLGTNYDMETMLHVENNNQIQPPPPLYDNDFENWLDENIEEKKYGILKLKDVCEKYLYKDVIELGHLPPKYTSIYRIQIEKYLEKKYPCMNSVYYAYRDSSFNGNRYRGWVGFQLNKLILINV
jgi:prophage antirepressor-like protein